MITSATLKHVLWATIIAASLLLCMGVTFAAYGGG